MKIRHVIIDGIDSGELGKLTKGRVWVTNVGALPVTVLHFNAQWRLEKVLPIQNPALTADDPLTQPVTINPAGMYKFSVPDRDITTMAEFEQIWPDSRTDLSKHKTLFLIGYVKYRDEIGLRRTYFAYRFNARRHRFVPIKHANYNYTD